MNRLTTEKRVAVVKALVEGCSIRATVRLTGVAKNTIVKLLVDLGAAAVKHHDATVRNLKTKRVQADEIWAFCYAKQRRVTEEMRVEHPDAGDVWTWTAIDADSKLMISWIVGDRSATCAYELMGDVASRVANRTQITTDGLPHYSTAIEAAFGENVDYAILNKIYAEQGRGRYSPPKFMGCTRNTVCGQPDAGHISTSYVERQNLTMRMSMRRFTRLTNGFSKKVENHAAAVALYFMFYNFGRVHQTLRVTPAMEAGITDHVWDVEEIVALLEN